MSSDNASLKPIKLWSHSTGPNPWKVVIILKTLNIPYTTEYVEFSKIKEEPFISVNPNGRVPAIEDPNTGMTLWESGAILQYLVEKYDKSNTISFPAGSDEWHLANQWLMFQMSGFGPYLGQAAWFKMFHHEKLPSAIERYQKETARVISVIDLHLTRTNQKYLVADAEHKEGKLSVADLSFVTWAVNAPYFADGLFDDGKNKAYQAWMESLLERPAVAESLKEKAEVSKK